MFKVEEIQLETGMQSWLGSWMVLPGDGGEIINRISSSSHRAWDRGDGWPSSLLYPKLGFFSAVFSG